MRVAVGDARPKVRRYFGGPGELLSVRSLLSLAVLVRSSSSAVALTKYCSYRALRQARVGGRGAVVHRTRAEGRGAGLHVHLT